jgi:hypothetical protein
MMLMSGRYVFETMTSFGLLFVAFGVGLDPRQRGVFGPALSPILVCILKVLCVAGGLEALIF